MIPSVFVIAWTTLPVLAFLLAVTVPRRLWHSREVPADTFRVGTGVAFSAWVDPSLGIFSALAGARWLQHGWPRLAGGTLLPVVAMGLSLSLVAPAGALHVGLAGFLAMGVVQSLIAILQRCGVPICPAGQIHGTFGHRTGLGIFLAVLTPLAFLTSWGPWLAIVFGVVLALAPSAVAAIAVTAGLLVTFPALWPLVLVAGLALAARRLIGRRVIGYPGLAGAQVLGFGFSTLETLTEHRWRIWCSTWNRLRRWPVWAIGAGPGAFALHARTWIRPDQHREVYAEAHNDWLELAYEFGLVGMLAVAWWVWRIHGALAWQDPVTGAGVAFATAMLGSFPAKVAPLAVLALFLAVLLMRRVAG